MISKETIWNNLLTVFNEYKNRDEKPMKPTDFFNKVYASFLLTFGNQKRIIRVSHTKGETTEFLNVVVITATKKMTIKEDFCMSKYVSKNNTFYTLNENKAFYIFHLLVKFGNILK